jgi:hypothetical protein
MGEVLELERADAETFLAVGKTLAAAHAWDGTRALARLVLGPEDPRTWSSLARCARSLGDSDAEQGKTGEDLDAAAAVAAGAVEGLETAAGTVPPSELAFARETLALILKRNAAAGRYGAPAPLRSLADAIYPERSPADEDPFPSPDELRAGLILAEGPGGPGPGSRAALKLRSLLGAELMDSGGLDAAEEAFSLMREASEDLDRLAGPRDPDSMEAAERLARRLGGMPGYGAILPAQFPPDTLERLLSAHSLFSRLAKDAPVNERGLALRNRARIGAAGVAFVLAADEYSDRAPRRFSAPYLEVCSNLMGSGSWVLGQRMLSVLDLEGARCAFDLAEWFLMDRDDEFSERYHAHALLVRRHLLGGRHPETATSLARTGDLHSTCRAMNRACAHWAFALEALEGRGARYDAWKADLEYRIGRAVLLESEAGYAVPLFRRPAETFAALYGESSQQALEVGSFLARALYWTGDLDGAAEIYGRTAELLDGAPPRRDPDPHRPPDTDLLSLALAGSGAIAVRRGDRRSGEKLLRRSAKLVAAGSKSTAAIMGDSYRSEFLPDLAFVRNTFRTGGGKDGKLTATLDRIKKLTGLLMGMDFGGRD